MRKLLSAALAAVTLCGSVLGAAAPASAQEWRHGGGEWRGHRGDDDAGIGIAAGIAGLALGAALASNGGYHRGYYRSYPGYYGYGGGDYGYGGYGGYGDY